MVSLSFPFAIIRESDPKQWSRSEIGTTHQRSRSTCGQGVQSRFCTCSVSLSLSLSLSLSERNSTVVSVKCRRKFSVAISVQDLWASGLRSAVRGILISPICPGQVTITLPSLHFSKTIPGGKPALNQEPLNRAYAP